MSNSYSARSIPGLLLISLIFAQVGCLEQQAPTSPEPNTVSTTENAATAVSVSQPVTGSESSAAKVKNVILVVGDGMGPQQLGLLFAYAKQAPNSTIPDRISAVELMSQEASLALVRTNPYGALVTDSAASATQMATGEMAGSEMIGANYKGESVPTVLEIAQARGRATGLVSDTRITHATPAAFAAHQPHRTRENEIAEDLLKNRVDVMLSAGLRYFVPQSVNDPQSTTHMEVLQLIGGAYRPSSKRNDNRNLLIEAREDYQLVFDRGELEKVTDGRVLGLFANSNLDDAISTRDRMEKVERSEPTLAEMTGKALELLSQDQDGFFLMVEAGQIDWCGHNNDTGSLLHELLRLDEAVRTIYEWVKDRDDTLVIITADHETGSFGFSYSGSPMPKPQPLEGKLFHDDEFAPFFNFAAPNVLDQIYDQQRSYFKVFLEFDSLAEQERTPEKLMAMINDAIAPFSINLEEAELILKRMPNQQYTEGHRYLGTETLPFIPDQEEFFVYGENLRLNHLGHIIGAQQNVVWGTGTHTSTPVALIAHGPASATRHFKGLMHMTDVGKAMISVVRGE